MTVETERGELLEIYRLHAELADRVSQRREGANRLYVGLLMALVVFLAALLRLTPGSLPRDAITIAACLMGAALSASWWLVIRSYRKLNTGKLKALQELERRLACVLRQGVGTARRRQGPGKVLAAHQGRGCTSVDVLRGLLRRCGRGSASERLMTCRAVAELDARLRASGRASGRQRRRV